MRHSHVKDATVRQPQVGGCPELGESQRLIGINSDDLDACGPQILTQGHAVTDPGSTRKHLGQA